VAIVEIGGGKYHVFSAMIQIMKQTFGVLRYYKDVEVVMA
jgi:hypothetical protein